MLRLSLELMEKIHGSDHPKVASSVNNLAVVLSRQARFAEVESLHHRALMIWCRNPGPESMQVARGLANLGALEMARARFEESESYLTRARVLSEAALGPTHPETGEILSGFGRLYFLWRRYDDAVKPCRRALEIIETSLGSGHLKTSILKARLARVLLKQGHLEEAGTFFQEALAIAQSAADPIPRATILQGLAELHHLRGELATADEMGRDVHSVFQSRAGSDEIAFSSLLHFLAPAPARPGPVRRSRRLRPPCPGDSRASIRWRPPRPIDSQSLLASLPGS